LFVPVSRERYQRALIRWYERALRDVESVAPLGAAPSPTMETWLREEKPRLRAELAKSLADMKRTGSMPPAQIEQVRTNQERYFDLREETIRRQAEAAPAQREAVERGRSRSTEATRAQLEKARAELEVMSPAERAAPACATLNLIPCDQRGTARIVTLDPRYFDAALPASALQLIIVETPSHKHMMEDSRAFRVRMRIAESLDYEALAALLR
jgi:hypothetical protein